MAVRRSASIVVWGGRIVRAVLVAAVAAVLAFVLVGVALQRQSVQLVAMRWLSELLDADVTYDVLRIAPARGIDLRGVAVRGWPNAASSLYARRVVIRPDWRELFGGALRFRSLRIEGWAIVLKPGQPSDPNAPPVSGREPPPIEVVDIELYDGSIFLPVGSGSSLRVSEVDGLVRITGAESSIRLRHLAGSVGDRIEVSGQVSLWRLADGPWDAQISATTEAGTLIGTASSADGGWTWDVAVESMDLATWAQAIGPGVDGLSGTADFEASGQGSEARGRITITRPAWGSLKADEASASIQAAPGLLVARRIHLRRQQGHVRGTATFRTEGHSWVTEADLRADSMTVLLPPDRDEPIVVSGDFGLSGRFAEGRPELKAAVRDGGLAWRSWRVQQVDADLLFDEGVVNLEHLTIGSGTLTGSAHGWVSDSAMVLNHDLRIALRPTLAPFLGQPVGGFAHSKGTLSGPFSRVTWQGAMQTSNHHIGTIGIASGLFVGQAGLSDGRWRAEGTAEVGDLSISGRRVLLAARGRLKAAPEKVSLAEGVILRPGGVLMRIDGEWEHDLGRIDRFVVLSDRWALAAVGGASVHYTGRGFRMPRLRMATSAGGFLEAHEAMLTQEGVVGLMLVNHIPVDAVAQLLGLPGRYSGRCYAAVQAGGATHGWASIRDLRRLPAMKDFPVDVDLQFSRDPAQTVVRSLGIRQGDLKIVGAGRVDSAGALDASIRTERSPLGRVLIVSDELLNAGLRPIFDARTGTVSAAINVGGSIRRPSFSGDITVDGGAEVSVKPIRTVFRSVEGTGRWEGHSILIDNVSGASGKGRAQLRGRLELPALVLDAASFDIAGRLQEFRLIRGIYGIYDADVKLAKRRKGIGLEGEARLIEGLIDLPSIPIEPMPPSEAGMDDLWFLNIVADRGVWVRDRFLNAEVAGRVAVTKEDGIVALQGDLEVLRGTYLYLGRKFVLQQGTVSFLGGPLIMPELDVSATTVVRAEQRDGSDITLTLTVTGRVDDPVLRVAADDESYSEEQIKTMLLFNLTPEDVVTLWQGDAFAKEAAGAVEEFLAGELVRVLRAESGLDELELSPNLLSSEDRDLYVRMGKYLTPDLFVSVAKGLRSIGLDEVRVEYLLRAWAQRMGLGKNVDLKLVGERTHDEFSRTNYQVQMKLKYKF